MRTALFPLLVALCPGGAAYVWITGHLDHVDPEHTAHEARTSSNVGEFVASESTSSVRVPARSAAPRQSASSDFRPASAPRAANGQAGAIPPTDVFARAVDAFDSGRYDEAKTLFLEVADLDTRALSGAGIAAFRLRDWQGSVRHLRQAVERGQDGFLEHKFLALAYNQMDDIEHSLSHANAALERKEDHEMAILLSKLCREREVREGFIAEETEHFRTLYDGYVHGSVNRRILDILEDAYRDIGNRLDFFPDGTLTVVLYTKRDFSDVILLPVWTAGAFDGRIHLPIGGLEDTEASFLRTVIYHEYVHALVHRMARGVPKWLNEGLADYLVDRGLPRTGQDIPLRDLEQGFPMGDESRMMRAYAVSYSAVAYLVEEHGLWRMHDFLLSKGRGQTLDEAFRDAFSTSYGDFLATWGQT